MVDVHIHRTCVLVAAPSPRAPCYVGDGRASHGGQRRSPERSGAAGSHPVDAPVASVLTGQLQATGPTMRGCMRPWCAHLVGVLQRLDEVVPHVLHILDADCKPNEVLLDADLRTLLRPKAPVALHCRHLNQRLHAAQRGPDVWDLDVVDELGAVPEVSTHLERHNATKAGHLALGNRVVWVALQPGVPHSVNLRVRLKAARDLHARRVLALNAQLQRLHASQQQVGCIRVDHAAHDVVELAHSLDQVFLATQRARQHIVVAGQVLGARVQHKVSSQLQRLGVDGRSKRGVDAHCAALGMAQLHDRRDVDAAQVWVCGRLAEEERRLVLIERLFQARQVVGRKDGQANIHLRQKVDHELARAPVAVRRGNDVAVSGHEGQEHAGHAVHATRRHQTVLRALQVANLGLHRLHRRVAVAAILVALEPTLVILDELPGVVEPVRGCLHDRRRQRVTYTRAAAALAAMHNTGSITTINWMGGAVG
mmetsp:Transcript_13584/g.39341  ORF Transcript_13584/g.39341 Transcript_13584/m.39341 type:complete len:481 (-) Transcript_13584:300-1742(-)